MAASESRIKNMEYSYDVPKKYEMMSERKFRLALGTAIGALIAAVILAWIGLSPKAPDAAQSNAPKPVMVKKS